MQEKKRQECFVIMPFSETSREHTKRYWTKHFNTFLKPLIQEHPELEAHRSKPLRGDITDQIIRDLMNCPVVVADLTDSNPNVYWELGVRQSFKHGTVTIAEEGTKLPSDIGAKGTLFYSDNHIKNAEFLEQFREALNDCLTHPDKPDSRVLELIHGRGTLFEIFRQDEAIRRMYALLSECNNNLELLNVVVPQVESNQKDPKEAAIVTLSFRSQALELLITNRYLDVEPAFYISAEECLTFILGLNGQVGLWPHQRDSVDKWLLNNCEKAKVTFQNFKDTAKAVRDQLAVKF